MKTDLVMIIHGLHGGGAERVFAGLANRMFHSGRYRVRVITLGSASEDVFCLDEGIERTALGVLEESPNFIIALWKNFVRIRLIRQVAFDGRADVVISFCVHTNVLTLLAGAAVRGKVAIAERIDPDFAIGRSWELLRRLTYPMCDLWVVQTQRVARKAQRFVKNRPVAVIPNPVEPVCRSNTAHRSTVVLGVGRLEEQKGFDRLLEAFAVSTKEHLEWTLVIAGEGSQKQSLLSLAARLGVGDRVQMVGWCDDLTELYCSSGIFVLSSRSEGHPNVLIEAMAHGMPVVAFDCESGPAEIIDDGVNGLLVPDGDIDLLAQALHDLVNKPTVRHSIGCAATNVRQKFGVDAVDELWHSAISELAER